MNKMINMNYQVNYQQYPKELHYFLDNLPTITNILASTYTEQEINKFKGVISHSKKFNSMLIELLPEKFQLFLNNEEPKPKFIYAAYKNGKVYPCETEDEALKISDNNQCILLNHEEISLHKNMYSLFDQVLEKTNELYLSKQSFHINFHDTIYKQACYHVDDDKLKEVMIQYNYHEFNNFISTIIKTHEVFSNVKAIKQLHEPIFNNIANKLNEEFKQYSNNVNFKEILTELNQKLDYNQSNKFIQQQAKNILKNYFPNLIFEENIKYAAYKDLEVKIFDNLLEAKKFSNTVEEIVENNDIQINNKQQINQIVDTIIENAFYLKLLESSLLPPQTHYVIYNQIKKDNDFNTIQKEYYEIIDNFNIEIEIPQFIKSFKKVEPIIQKINDKVKFVEKINPNEIPFNDCDKENIENNYIKSLQNKMIYNFNIDNILNVSNQVIQYIIKTAPQSNDISNSHDFYKLFSIINEEDKEQFVKTMGYMVANLIKDDIELKLQISQFIENNCEIKKEKNNYSIYLKDKAVLQHSDIMDIVIESKPEIFDNVLTKSIAIYCKFNKVDLNELLYNEDNKQNQLNKNTNKIKHNLK